MYGNIYGNVYTKPANSYIDQILKGVKWGLIIGGIIILIWWIWSYAIYRWDVDRIKTILVDKYTLFNRASIGDDHTATYSDVRIDNNANKVYFTVDIRSNIDLESVEKLYESYNMITNPDECSIVSSNCIVV
jgi:hypothetical protein